MSNFRETVLLETSFSDFIYSVTVSGIQVVKDSMFCAPFTLVLPVYQFLYNDQ